MTKSEKKSKKAQGEGTTTALDTMAAFGPMGEAAQKAWVEMGTETLRFVASRMQQDLETQKAMLACTDLGEMQKIQSEFYSQAMEEYRAQAARMMEIMSSAAPKGLDGVPLMTKRAYDDVPL
ncbi:MAG TPA: phasin family protein [Roseovarius sp.]